MSHARVRRLAPLLAVLAVLAGAITAWAAGNDSSVAVTRFVAPTSTSAIAQCPDGQRATGGGLVGSDTQTRAQRFSTPLDETGLAANIANGDVARQWQAGVVPTSGASEHKVYALCSATSDATIRMSTSSLAADETAEISVGCPSTSRALGGGISSGTGDMNHVGINGPYDDTNSITNADDGDVAKFWHASVYNSSKSRQSFRVFALCSPTSDATLKYARIVGIGGFQKGSATAMCPAGRHATGGGIASTTAPKPQGSGLGAILSIVADDGPVDAVGTDISLTTGATARGWRASILNVSGAPQDYKVLAICESDPPAATPVGPTGPSGPSGPSGPTGPTTEQPLALSVRPARVKARKRKTFTFTVTSNGSPVGGATVSMRNRQSLSGDDGRAAITRKFVRRGTVTATAARAGFTPATATITVRKAR